MAAIDATAIQATALRNQIRDHRQALRKLNYESLRGAQCREAYQSEEWRRIRKFVIWKARGHCMACGRNGLTLDVHHVSYEYGILAPCFVLQATCRECHDRLHDGWFGYLNGPPRQYKLAFAANDNGGIDPVLTQAKSSAA